MRGTAVRKYIFVIGIIGKEGKEGKRERERWKRKNYPIFVP